MFFFQQGSDIGHVLREYTFLKKLWHSLDIRAVFDLGWTKYVLNDCFIYLVESGISKAQRSAKKSE